ncbi:hypothetical protein IC614_07585 [Allosphingosinicella flava]|uniref:Uncharacterized protein n=1 Tax=Allosphingosinicella flava TaxID=2771430 RepID=A0A7T2GHZ3_9SPHN|nr:hypothetical protein [Sphingosinicella flava]QPQ54226.1 hypothetical protein IC614_07585 [Sphingosinicella flava]
MSRIPNKAMKHATSNEESHMSQQEGRMDQEGGQMGQEEGGSWRRSFAQMSQQMSDGATRVADKARERPVAALAVGGAVLGAVAAAAVPLFRWSRDGETAGRSGKSAKAASARKSSDGAKARGKKKQ